MARSGRPARQRLRLVARRGWLLLVLLLLVLGCVGATFSGADVTSTGANPGVVFTAGNLRHTNNRANRAILTSTRLVPGGTATGTVTIRNTGDIDGDFSLSSSDIVDTPGSNGGRLSGVLTLAIDGTTAPAYTVYNGPLTAMPTLALGTWDLTSSLATAGFADIFSQETDPDALSGYAVRAGAAPPQLAAVRTDGASSVNLGGYSNTTATVWANRTLTVKTPATLPPGVTQVRARLTRVAAERAVSREAAGAGARQCHHGAQLRVHGPLQGVLRRRTGTRLSHGGANDRGRVARARARGEAVVPKVGIEPTPRVNGTGF